MSSAALANGQPTEQDFKYRSPLDRATLLSASFAELRPNHFHSGLDFKVGGAPGAKLHAVERGYVSRIGVSPFGYGKAVYINHPNGQTSVYGHLHEFSSKIKAYIEAVQYERNTFTINEYDINPELLPVDKGEVIGLAGNSGSSFGAHLHFEIRDTETQAPLNTLAKQITKIKDNLPPVVNMFAVYTLDSTFTITTPRQLKMSRVIKKGTGYVPEKEGVIQVYNPAFFAVSANDFMPDSHNKLGVYKMQAYLDDELFWGYQIDDFLFDETRYINSFMAYDEVEKNKRNMVKTYVEEGNKLRFYQGVKNNGFVILEDTLVHTIRFDLFDENGNKSALSFKIKKSKKSNPNNNNLLDPGKYTPVNRNRLFVFENDSLKVELAENSLYSNMLFLVNAAKPRPGMFAPVWKIGNPGIPLHQPMIVSLKNNVPEQWREKAVIVSVNEKGRVASHGGTMDSLGVISSSVSRFGSYSVMIDTVPPTIKAAFVKGADFRAKNSLTVTIADNLSGIAKYNGYIDGEWALFDYDAKNRAFTYIFDGTRIKKGKRHTLKVVVEDAVNNVTTFDSEFLW